MSEPGIGVVSKILPNLRKAKQIDLVIAQAENVTKSKSMSINDMKKLQKIGVDFFSGGNHTPKLKELHSLLEDSKQPVIGPANMNQCPGKGWKFIDTSYGPVLIISILGETFSKIKPDITNPLVVIDNILEDIKGKQCRAIVVNIHGDYSSEKIVFGYYLDGKVTAVIGDHWHVPTADAMIFPKGTAHITDVGMCGVLHSSLGIKTQVIIDRWKNSITNRNELEDSGPLQFNALLLETNSNNLLAKSVEHISIIDNQN